jgi:hypothetical protein
MRDATHASRPQLSPSAPSNEGDHADADDDDEEDKRAAMRMKQVWM